MIDASHFKSLIWETNSTCPPLTTWSDGPFEINIVCKSSGADLNGGNICNELNCHELASCEVDENANPYCNCLPGYVGDGQNCEKLELINECFLNLHSKGIKMISQTFIWILYFVKKSYIFLYNVSKSSSKTHIFSIGWFQSKIL